MIYTFKSSAVADVIMQRFSAEQMLAIIGKQPGEMGVITVSEMPAAIDDIESEIERQEGLAPSFLTPEAEDEKKYDPVRLRERAAPFIELLKASQEANVNVVWGL